MTTKYYDKSGTSIGFTYIDLDSPLVDMRAYKDQIIEK